MNPEQPGCLAQIGILLAGLVVIGLLSWAMIAGVIPAFSSSEDSDCPSSLRNAYAEAGEFPPPQCR